MITWPAMVPTVDADSPEATSEMANTVLEAGPSSGVSVSWAVFHRRHVAVAGGVEGRRGHHQHGGVDQAGQAHGADGLERSKWKSAADLLLVEGRDAVLHQVRVEEDDVRHDRRAEDADRQQHAFGPANCGDEHVAADLAPIGRGPDHLDHVARGDHADQRHSTASSGRKP